MYLQFNIKVIKVAQDKSSHIPEKIRFRSLAVAEKQKFSDYRYYLTSSVEYWVLIQQST